MFYLGEMHRNGYGVQKDCKKASVWYRRAAKKNNLYAKMNLARLYKEGKIGKSNPKRTEYWIRTLILRSDMLIDMGFMYDEGYPVIECAEDAVWWYRLSAEQEDPNGQCNLGNLYC